MKNIKINKKKRHRKSPTSIEAVAKFFTEQGCKLLETEFHNNKAPLQYKCKCGNIRYTCWNNFSRGLGCQICYLKKFEKSKRRRMVPLVMRQALFNMTQAAKLLGVDYDQFRTEVKVTRSLPEPTHQIPGRVKFYYSREDINAISEMLILIP